MKMHTRAELALQLREVLTEARLRRARKGLYAGYCYLREQIFKVVQELESNDSTASDIMSLAEEKGRLEEKP